MLTLGFKEFQHLQYTSAPTNPFLSHLKKWSPYMLLGKTAQKVWTSFWLTCTKHGSFIMNLSVTPFLSRQKLIKALRHYSRMSLQRASITNWFHPSIQILVPQSHWKQILYQWCADTLSIKCKPHCFSMENWSSLFMQPGMINKCLSQRLWWQIWKQSTHSSGLYCSWNLMRKMCEGEPRSV